MSLKFLSGEKAVEWAKEGGIKILNVTAPWCGPCKMMAPIFEELAETYDIVKVDSDENQEWVSANQITGVPTTFLFKDGKIQGTIVGYIPKEEFLSRINSLKG